MTIVSPIGATELVDKLEQEFAGTIFAETAVMIRRLAADNERIIASHIALVKRLEELAAGWGVLAERPQCADRMKKRILRQCRDELISRLRVD